VRTLNLACGVDDKFGTDKLDWKSYGLDGIRIFDLNSLKPLPYESNTFDEIRFWNALQVMVYPQEVLEECHRILKPGGILDVSAMNSESLFYIFVQRIRDNPVRFGFKAKVDNGHTMGTFNIRMLANRLERAGFKNLEKQKDVKKWGFHAYVRIRCMK